MTRLFQNLLMNLVHFGHLLFYSFLTLSLSIQTRGQSLSRDPISHSLLSKTSVLRL